MPEQRTSAVILNTRDYGEIDRIVTLYTQDFGKIAGIAKGARRSQRRFGAALDSFSHVDLSFFTKETMTLARISYCQLRSTFPSLHEDIVRMGYASYFAELVMEMSAEGVPNKGVYDMLVTFLHIVNTCTLKEDYLHIFEIRLLDALGYRPCFDRCTHCKTEIAGSHILHFSVAGGGVVCNQCNPSFQALVPISSGTLKLLQQSYSLNLNKIQRLVFSSQALEESREILPRFIQYHLEKELKALKFIARACADRHSKENAR